MTQFDDLKEDFRYISFLYPEKDWVNPDSLFCISTFLGFISYFFILGGNAPQFIAKTNPLRVLDFLSNQMGFQNLFSKTSLPARPDPFATNWHPFLCMWEQNIIDKYIYIIKDIVLHHVFHYFDLLRLKIASGSNYYNGKLNLHISDISFVK